MSHITGLLLALAICKGVTASGGNNTINTKDSYTNNNIEMAEFLHAIFSYNIYRFTVEMRGHS